MATKSNRTNPVRTTNNNNGAAVRNPKHYSDTIKTLRAVGKRGESIGNHIVKTYDEIESIVWTIDALAVKISDGEISPNKIIDALRKIEDRLHSVNGRLNYAELNIANLAGDAEWIADGNSISND